MRDLIKAEETATDQVIRLRRFLEMERGTDEAEPEEEGQLHTKNRTIEPENITPDHL